MAECFERVYTYKNGKVKELFSVYSGEIDKIYLSKGICAVSGIHSGGCWEYYYIISSGKCKCIVTRSGSGSVKGHEGDFCLFSCIEFYEKPASAVSKIHHKPQPYTGRKFWKEKLKGMVYNGKYKFIKGVMHGT